LEGVKRVLSIKFYCGKKGRLRGRRSTLAQAKDQAILEVWVGRKGYFCALLEQANPLICFLNSCGVIDLQGNGPPLRKKVLKRIV